MTAPAAGYIQLPLDTGNTGKKVQTQVETIGSDVVYAHLYVQRRAAKLTGVYRYCSAQNTVLATAHTPTATAFLYMFNPAANTGKNIRIRRAWAHSLNSTALATPTAPRLVMARSTFTGTASGAALTPDKVASAYGASSAYLSAAITGATVAAMVANVGAAGITQCVTAVGAMEPADSYILDAQGSEDEFEVLAAGECAVFYQDVAGTAADTRKVQINLVWDEIDIT